MLQILIIGASNASVKLAEHYAGQGALVTSISDTESVERDAGRHAPDLVVIACLSLGRDAVRIVEAAASGNLAPVVVLLDAYSVADHVIAVESGADDVWTAQSDSRLLLARSKALIRRYAAGAPHGHGRTVGDEWRLDLATREVVSPQGQRARLSPRETTVLNAFLTRPGVVLTLAALATELGIARPNRALRTAICRLREKLRQAGGQPIRTVRGSGGYVFQSRRLL